LILCETTNWFFYPQKNGPASLGIRRFTKNASGLRITNRLRSRGHRVKQIHNFTCFTLDELISILKKFSCDGKESVVVAISTSFLMINAGTKDFDYTCDKIKNFIITAKRKYKAKIVVGGWMISRLFKPMTGNGNIFQSLKNGEVDVFVEGDGTESLDRISRGLSISTSQIDGMNYHIADQVLDFSDESSAPLSCDHINQDESLVTEIASGCVFSCSFCNYGVLGKKKHEFMRSFTSLESEFMNNWNNFKTRVYTLTDNIINDNWEKVDMLIKIREKIDIRWVGYIRLDTLTKRWQIEKLRDSGIAGLNMGIESFCKTVGPKIGKMTDGEKLKDLLYQTREILGDSAVFTCNFIAGLPTETIDDLSKTHEWLSSRDGKYLVDSYKFVRLYLSPKQDLREQLRIKNTINISRGDPFLEYDVNDLGKWKSPWGKSEDFDRAVVSYNDTRSNPGTTWSLPVIHTAGWKIEDMIKSVRKNIPFDSAKFRERTIELISKYKGKVLNDL
jgi:hypothetical protein